MALGFGMNLLQMSSCELASSLSCLHRPLFPSLCIHGLSFHGLGGVDRPVSEQLRRETMILKLQEHF